jgi:hypothetical protein
LFLECCFGTCCNTAIHESFTEQLPVTIAGDRSKLSFCLQKCKRCSYLEWEKLGVLEMTHTIDTLMAMADEYTRLCTFMQDGTTAESAKTAREALRTALIEALQERDTAQGMAQAWKLTHDKVLAAWEAAQPVREPLTSDQLMALTLCHEDKRVSVSKVQRILRISYKEAQDLCQSIIDAGQCDGMEISPNLHGIGGKK